MTEKEVRKLKRRDLLEILVEQGKQIEKLSAENEELQKKLSDRMINIDNAGSIAEASLQLNGIFEAAQAASAQYLENIQHLHEKQENVCAQMELETREKCDAMLREAERGVEERWGELSQRLESFYNAHKGLRELLASVESIRMD